MQRQRQPNRHGATPVKKAVPEQTDQPFPKGVAAPAQRALASIGITRLDQLTRVTESKLQALHGMGPKAIEALKQALREMGKSLAAETE
ncbi:hypothetical protein BH10PLA2_BH10PLA2_24380 [soil metagenome]